MKMLKSFYSLNLFILAILLLFHSCDQEEELSPIKGVGPTGECFTHNYLVDEEQRECVCPSETHYVLEHPIGAPTINSQPYCREKKDNNYFYKANSKCCIYEVDRPSNVNAGYENRYEAIGSAEFDFDNLNFHLFMGSGDYGERTNGSVFGGAIGLDQAAETISFNSDGSFSIHMAGIGNFEKRCEDWAERNPKCTYWTTETIGKSNADRTEVDLMIIWKDCDEVVVDTGRIHMWREW